MTSTDPYEYVDYSLTWASFFSFLAYCLGIILLFALALANYLIPMEMSWNITMGAIGAICVIGSQVYSLRKSGNLRKKIAEHWAQPLSTLLGLACLAMVAFFLTRFIVTGRVEELTQKADNQFVAGQYADAAKTYGELERAMALEDPVRQARYTEKVGVAALMMSQLDDAETKLKLALKKRFDLLVEHCREHGDDNHPNCKGQTEYMARLETNLGLLAIKTHNSVNAAKDEKQLVEQIRMLDGGSLVKSYFTERVNGLQRVGNPQELARVAEIAQSVGITIKPAEMRPISWMHTNQVDVGGRTKRRALYLP